MPKPRVTARQRSPPAGMAPLRARPPRQPLLRPGRRRRQPRPFPPRRLPLPLPPRRPPLRAKRRHRPLHPPLLLPPLSRIKKISGANLARNWVMIPHVTQFDEADITDLEALRVEVNKENENAGIKLTLLAFLMKACVAALRKFPEFNASLDGESL